MNDEKPEEVHGTASFDPVTQMLCIVSKLKSGKIKTQRYRVVRLHPQGDHGSPAVRLQATNRMVYDLIRTSFGWTCSCQDFVARREKWGMLCKHLKAVLKTNAINQLPMPGDAFEG